MKMSSIIKKITDVIRQGNNIVYIVTLAIATLCIFLSFGLANVRQAETILQGLGCSAIAASIMAFFIDYLQKQKTDKKKSEYRQALLSNLNQELKKCLERVIWFDEAILKLDMDKDIQYYLSLDFFRETWSLDLYQVMDGEKAAIKVSEILKKHDEIKQGLPVDEDLAKKMTKMFKIIGIASGGIQKQLDKLYEERFLIISSGIMNEGELLEIYHTLNHMVDYLEFNNKSYGTPIVFIFNAYKKIRALCNYKNEFFITWQPPEGISEMIIEDRKKKEEQEQRTI